MAFSLSSPVTGQAQTGLTSPTYTLSSDTPPAPNMKQWVVSALGGTQTGVIPHAIASPFLLSVSKPVVFKMLGTVNPSNGLLRAVPMNSYKVITLKGVTPLAGQPYSKARVETVISVPAGSDLVDPASIRAMLSFHLGSLVSVSAGLGDTVVSGIL